MLLLSSCFAARGSFAFRRSELQSAGGIVPAPEIAPVDMSNLRFRQSRDASDDASPATLTQRVYELLREEILSGQLAPGCRLVRRALAARLGVSPIPVTEALLRLEVEGLVESRPLCGCRVRPLELEDVQNEAVLREAIECQAARLSAENAQPADHTRLAAEAKRLDPDDCRPRPALAPRGARPIWSSM